MTKMITESPDALWPIFRGPFPPATGQQTQQVKIRPAIDAGSQALEVGRGKESLLEVLEFSDA
jgi:hypothetical protein